MRLNWTSWTSGAHPRGRARRRSPRQGADQRPRTMGRPTSSRTWGGPTSTRTRGRPTSLRMRVRGLLTPAPALKVSALTPAPALKVAALLVEDGFRARRAGDQGRSGVGWRLVFLRPVRPGLQVELTRETAQFGWRRGPPCWLLLLGPFLNECLEKETFTAKVVFRALGCDPCGRHAVVARCALFSGFRNARSVARGACVLKP